MFAAPTSIVNVAPVPVSVVEPIPLLETPVIGRFWYEGAGISIFGVTYPLPTLLILNLSAPPVPVFVIPTLTVKVLVVTAVIANVALWAGSPPAELGVGPERGYEWSVEKF